MTTRVVTNEQERVMLIRYIEGQALPFTAEVVKGKRRTNDQNRLQRQWVKDIAEQLGDRTQEEVRAYCKLRFGIPILRAGSELFREKYDRVVKPHNYAEKLEMMAEPFDFPVTRLMNTKQKTAYLDEINRHFSALGIILTDPSGLVQRGSTAETTQRAA